MVAFTTPMFYSLTSVNKTFPISEIQVRVNLSNEMMNIKQIELFI